MAKLNLLIQQTRALREWHRAQRIRGVRGAGIEAAACAIREKALLEAKAAIEADK